MLKDVDQTFISGHYVQSNDEASVVKRNDISIFRIRSGKSEAIISVLTDFPLYFEKDLL